jgi:hypothetical protein
MAVQQFLQHMSATARAFQSSIMTQEAITAAWRKARSLM